MRISGIRSGGLLLSRLLNVELTLSSAHYRGIARLARCRSRRETSGPVISSIYADSRLMSAASGRAGGEPLNGAAASDPSIATRTTNLELLDEESFSETLKRFLDRSGLSLTH